MEESDSAADAEWRLSPGESILDSSMRQIAGVVLGLGFGIAGTFLFIRSLPPDEGSAEDRAEAAELELTRARTRVKELEAVAGGDGRQRTLADGAREIAEDMKAGRLVDVDDVFRTTKPWMRHFAPIFDRIRVRDQKRLFDTLAGEYTRKYGLTDRQQEALGNWFDETAERNGDRFSEVMESESSGLEDMIRASRDQSRADGLDAFMEQLLRGDALARYRDDRMLERVENVQAEADRKVQRLDAVVDLDESQKDDVFALMARGSVDFDPSMRIEGLGAEEVPLAGQSRDEAVLAVLRPEQVDAYTEHRRRRMEAAEEELKQLGLRLPRDWDVFDEDDF